MVWGFSTGVFSWMVASVVHLLVTIVMLEMRVRRSTHSWQLVYLAGATAGLVGWAVGLMM